MGCNSSKNAETSDQAKPADKPEGEAQAEETPAGDGEEQAAEGAHTTATGGDKGDEVPVQQTEEQHPAGTPATEEQQQQQEDEEQPTEGEAS